MIFLIFHRNLQNLKIIISIEFESFLTVLAEEISLGHWVCENQNTGSKVKSTLRYDFYRQLRPPVTFYNSRRI